MTERRMPRAHLQPAVADETRDERPLVTAHLVEYLEKRFALRLSPIPIGDGTTAEQTLTDQARQTGQQEVINLLRDLSKL